MAFSTSQTALQVVAANSGSPDGLNYNSFPGLCRAPNGTLVLAYHHANDHVGSGTNKLYVQQGVPDGSGGYNWSSPQTLATTSGVNLADVGCVTLPNDDVMVTWNESSTPGHATISTVVTWKFIKSSANGDPGSWGSVTSQAVPGWATTVTPGQTGGAYAIAPCKPIVLKDGSLLLTTYGWNDRAIEDGGQSFSSHCYQKCMRSTNGGASWTQIGTTFSDTAGKAYDEGDLLLLDDGSLLAVSRVIYQSGPGFNLEASRSYDNGATWSTPVAILGNSSSNGYGGRPDLIQTGNGGVLLRTRYMYASASSWTAYHLSTDRGATWSAGIDPYTGGASGTSGYPSYPRGMDIYGAFAFTNTPNKVGYVWCEETSAGACAIYFTQISISSGANWLTRSTYSGPTGVSSGGGSHNYPFGYMRANGDIVTCYGGGGAGAPILYRVSTNKGSSWGAEQTLSIPLGGITLGTGQAMGITQIRRGRSGRLHASVARTSWFKDATYGDGIARPCTYAEVNWPTAVGNMIIYDPFYSYSDDDGATWATVEAVPYTGANGAAMDVCELSNGDVIVSWYGNGAASTPPYTSTGDYPDTKVSRRNHTTGAWSVIGTLGSKAAYGGAVVEAQHDVIHDGSTYGKVVAVFTNEGNSTTYARTSLDGGATWNTSQSLGSGVNRRGLCVGPDDDVILTYYNGSVDMMRVSQDGGATWSTATSLGVAGNKWVTPFPIGAAGVTPNVGVAYGVGSADNAGDSSFLALSQGSGGSVTVPQALTITPTSVWGQSGTSVSITNAPTNVRSVVSAAVQSTYGGPVSFTGTHADRFSCSLDGSTWSSSVNLPSGSSTLYLSVVPQSGDTSLIASVGVPL